MSNESSQTAAFELAGFIVDPTAGTLTRDGDAAQLQPKVMQLLVCLAEHHGQIVSKEYLLEHVWKGTFVVDGALRRCVFLLRKALADPNRETSILETLPRRGYRLNLAPEDMAPVAEQPAADDEKPLPSIFEGAAYRGLQVFEQTHADRFFGRRAAVAQVLNALDTQAESGQGFCLVLGPSGTGKSSLAMAGVVPALLARPDAQRSFVCATFKLSDSPTDPLEYFARCVVEVIEGQNASDERADALAQLLHADDEDAAVSFILEMLGAQEGDQQKHLLLVFDQFEELLTDEADEVLRTRLLSVLYPLVRSGAVWLLATMRSEFYPQFAAIDVLRYMRGEHGQVDLNFPGAAEITDIVRKPAELAGLSFDRDDQSRRLDQIIIDDAMAQANSLPLLQFALSQLELKSSDKVLRVADYHALGTLEGCLSRHADSVFDALSEPARNALPLVLERMVSADPRNAGRVLKRTVALREFDDHPGARDLVDAFIDARLITTFMDRVSGAPAAQFAHEAVLVNWERGNDWVQANYADIRFRTWINDLATRWNDDQRSNQYLLNDGKSLVEAWRLVSNQVGLASATTDFVAASHRRASVRDVVRGAVTVTLAALTVLSIFMWRSAENSRELAEAATRRAEATSDMVVSVIQQADPGVSRDRQLTAIELVDRVRARMAGRLNNAVPVDQAAMLAKLAEVYVRMGEYETAQELLSNAETLVPSIEKKFPAVASKVLLELGGIRRQLGALEESEDYLARSLALAQRADDPLLTAHSLNLQGLLAQARSDNAGALETYQRGLDVIETAVSSPGVIQLTPSLIANIASANWALSNYEAADEAFAQALAERVESGLDDTSDQTDTLSNRGALAISRGNHADAVDYFTQARELRTKLYKFDHPRNATYLVNTAAAQMKLEQFATAAKSASDGLVVVASRSGAGDDVVALLHAHLAMGSWLSNQSITADQMQAARAQISTLGRLYGSDHGLVLSVDLALIGLDLQKSLEDRPDAIESLCRRLAQAAAQLPVKEGSESPMQAKAASQLSSCDAYGKTLPLQ